MTCSRPPLPGGGCAYRGARMALEPIADAAHLVHGGATCSGFSWAMRPTASSGPRTHRLNLTTDLGELDTITGGEDKLVRAVLTVIDHHQPAGLFIYQTCLPAMIGDDVATLCRRLETAHGRPIIPVLLPGFAGDRDHGSRAAGDVLLAHLIGTREPRMTTATDVVMIGEANVAGEMDYLRGLLTEAGLRLVASIPGDGRIGDIATAHRARLVISLCSQSLGGLAEKMARRFAIPMIEGSFYGCANTARTLRSAADILISQGAAGHLRHQVDTAISRHETQAAARLRPILPALQGKRVLLMSGGIKAWSLVDALGELGMDVVGTTTQKTSEPERRRACSRLAGKAAAWDGATSDRWLNDHARADLVLSGEGFRATALRAGLAWVEINHDRPMALCGAEGLVNLARRIHIALRHPIRLGTPAGTRGLRREGAA